jgi:Calx-beta domain
MSAFTFRPQVEQLDSRVLPSANPVIAIDSVGVAEGDTGQTALVFHVTLSKASSHQVSVNFATGGGSATAGVDFVGQTGRLTFNPGETAKTITVLVNGDTDYEGDESFSVNLSGASRASIGTATGVGTIRNDDPSVLPPGDYIDPDTGYVIPSQPGDSDPYAADNPYYPNV